MTAGTTYYISVAAYSSNYGENTSSIGSNTGSGVWARARNMSGYVSASLHHTPTYNLDVNMYTNGEWKYSGDGVNKFHADVGGSRVATNASDLGYAAPKGTAYSITAVPGTGYRYQGTVSVSGYLAASGNYPETNFSVGLIFSNK